MERDLKWHIYNMEHDPLCWDDQALEFDNSEDAYDFLRGVNEDMLDGVVVVQDILFYNGGYLNATNLRVVKDEVMGIVELVEVRK